MFATYIVYGKSFSSLIIERIIRKPGGAFSRNCRLQTAGYQRLVLISLDQIFTYGDLQLRIFGQRNPYGISKTVFQKSANANRTFYSSVLSITSLRNSQMQRVTFTK